MRTQSRQPKRRSSGCADICTTPGIADSAAGSRQIKSVLVVTPDFQIVRNSLGGEQEQLTDYDKRATASWLRSSRRRSPNMVSSPRRRRGDANHADVQAAYDTIEYH